MQKMVTQGQDLSGAVIEIEEPAETGSIRWGDGAAPAAAGQSGRRSDPLHVTV